MERNGWKILKNKINKIWENFPITVKITLWYTAFFVILIIAIITVSFTVASKITGDLNQKELAKSVIEMTSDPDDFDDFDDGMYFVKYNSDGIEMAGMSPRGFDLTLEFKDHSVRTYENNGEKYYYFDNREKCYFFLLFHILKKYLYKMQHKCNYFIL